MSATDDVLAAARELAADLRAHYMLPNTWPTSQRFLRAVEALQREAHSEGQEPADGGHDQNAPQNAPPGPSRGPSPSAPPAPEKPEAGRRAPQT